MLDDSDLRSFLDLAPAPVLLLHRADRARPAPVITLVNRAFAELTGILPEALSGRSLRALRTIIDPGEPFLALLAAAVTGEPFAGQLKLRTAAGKLIQVQARARALPAQAERYVVWLDILPCNGAAAGRPALNEPARVLAGLSRECFYELAVDVDCRLRLAWADPRLADLTGYAPEELLELGGFFGLVLLVGQLACDLAFRRSGHADRLRRSGWQV